MENYAEIFSQIMRKRVSIMRKKSQIMRKFLKLIKLFPWLFPTYEVHVKVFMTCFRLLNMGKHPKLSKLVTSIQAPHQKTYGMECLEVKNCLQTKNVFSSLFWVKHFFKMINLFAIFVSEDGEQLLSCFLAIF